MAASGEHFKAGNSRQTGFNTIDTTIIQIGHDRPLQRGVFMRVSALNSGTIYVGFQDDLPELGVSKGFALFFFAVAGTSGFWELEIPIDNMNKLYFKATSSGQILNWYSI